MGHNRNFKIDLSNRNFGFSYDDVKEILREFNKFGEAHRRGLVNGVEIDLSHVNRFSDLSLGIIWGLALNYKDIKCDEKLIIFPPDKGNFFKDRKFFDRLTGVATKNPLSSAVPLNLETFNPSRPNSVYLNADKDIEKVFNQAAASFLSSDNSFHKELKTHMYEVITNSFDHSELQLEAGVICTLNKNGLLDFCVIDRGQGIKNSFLKNPILKNVYASMSDGQIINKATDLGVSCNPKIARNLNYKYTNGGIGLYFLREFIKFHKTSHLIIISQKGYYFIDSKGRFKIRNLENPWPGTIVCLRTDISQQKSVSYENISSSWANERVSIL